ncbi:hypothetical protein L484_019249 [Morus notabilis]|uniref:Fcf2 pre-rRNA processing C-terminal domain-containing protein n=1 Tax=Morus notabilis TaxID=981085 RepID=W9R1F9_9ROSA|nr:hypothetical protein L484_019249 [Morus notabilis]
MRESKGVVGLSWEPKLPNLSSATSSGSSSYTKAQSTQPESSVLWKASTELVDGLFVPPNNQRKLNKLLRKQVKDTTGSSWFDMPAPTMTSELQKDLQLLKVGTVIESPLDFFSGRLTKKERKASLANELLSDRTLSEYR